LEKLDIHFKSIELGVIETEGSITDEQKEALRSNLTLSGLELLEDKKSILVDKIKTLLLKRFTILMKFQKLIIQII
jgi:hypothetical protein